MIVRILASLAAQGVTGCVLNLHYLPQTIAAVVGDGADLRVRVRYSWEQPRILGSAGGPRHALRLIAADPLLIVNGDTLTEVPLEELERDHAASGAFVTLALVPNADFLRYGGVCLDEHRRVTGFVRAGPAAEGSYHYVGLQLAARSVFEPLADNEPASTIGGVYDRLIAAHPGSVAGCVLSGAFWDVGTVDDYWRMSDVFAVRERRDGVISGQHSAIDPTARVTHSILWDDVKVGAGAVVERCILTDGVRVPPGARHRDEILTADGPTDR